MNTILEIPSEGIRRKALLKTVPPRPGFHAPSKVSAVAGEGQTERDRYNDPEPLERSAVGNVGLCGGVRASRVDGLSRSSVSAGPGEETAEKGARQGSMVERSANNLQAPGSTPGVALPYLTPGVTSGEIAYADDDDFGLLEGFLSVLMIYGYVFILAVIFWNAHPISHWLYNHAQQLMGVLR